jgi:hypothetical protein
MALIRSVLFIEKTPSFGFRRRGRSGEPDSAGMDGWLAGCHDATPHRCADEQRRDCGSAFIPVRCRKAQHKPQQRFRQIWPLSIRLQNKYPTTWANFAEGWRTRKTTPRASVAFLHLADAET